MHPAFSVIFLTTLLGVGQGLFLALAVAQVIEMSTADLVLDKMYYVYGGVGVLGFVGLGLFASYFHLGRPERSWRAVTQWRTSWMSREVIALPAFMAVAFAWTAGFYLEWAQNTLLVLTLVGVILNFTLFICTGMIYACLKFLREWATPLTLVNFVVFGVSSGFIYAAAYSAYHAPLLVEPFAWFGVAFTLIGLITRSWTLVRNKQLMDKPSTTTQTAIGVKHPKVKQRSMGLMGGSYNTREFFHHKPETTIKAVKNFFMLSSFILPLAVLMLALNTPSMLLFILAFALQYVGLVAERWYFFVQVNHPQNIYYQYTG